MREIPLSTWMNNATAARSDAGGSLVAVLGRGVTLYSEAGIVVGRAGGDGVDGAVDCGPGFEAGFTRARGVGGFGEGGEGFAWTVEGDSQLLVERSKD